MTSASRQRVSTGRISGAVIPASQKSTNAPSTRLIPAAFPSLKQPYHPFHEGRFLSRRPSWILQRGNVLLSALPAKSIPRTSRIRPKRWLSRCTQYLILRSPIPLFTSALRSRCPSVFILLCTLSQLPHAASGGSFPVGLFFCHYFSRQQLQDTLATFVAKHAFFFRETFESSH